MTDSAVIQRLAELADDAEAMPVAAEARELAERLAAGRFYVACIGQFKRGKSTLLNALIGTPVLPTGVVPVTAVPTVLRYGDFGAQVRLAEGWRAVDPGALAEYVAESGNPSNRLGVRGVEVFVPSPLLAGGLCLVDTPGLGSAIEANTEATREFLPHIDAVLAVLGADPPISREELDFLAEAVAGVATLMVVLNKADRIRPAERAEAAAFSARMLEQRLGRPPGPILEVSALAGRRDESTRRGWRDLVSTLEGLPERAGRSILEAAARRGLDRLAAQLAWALEERRRALTEPMEASAARARALGALQGAADRALADAAPLLTAEQQRLSAWLAREREAFLRDATPKVAERLRADLESAAQVTRDSALGAARDLAEANLQDWLAQLEQRVQVEYTAAMRRYRELGADLVGRLLAAVPGGTTPGLDVDETDGPLAAPRRFFFAELLHYHYPATPWWHAAQWLLPASIRRRRAHDAAEAYLRHLLEVNSSRVQGDLEDRLRLARGRLESAVRELLERVARGAEDALARARAAQQAGEWRISQEVERIGELLSRLRALAPSPGKAA
ncbi:MAG TPA: dynamin family protein [Gemmatimonadales bacterium]|nr:dynamin family protein [Gemmatimonadales bacterium]